MNRLAISIRPVAALSSAVLASAGRSAPRTARQQVRHKGKVTTVKDHFRKLRAPKRHHGEALSSRDKFIYHLGTSANGRVGPAVVAVDSHGPHVVGPPEAEGSFNKQYIYMDDEQVDEYLADVRRAFEFPVHEEDVALAPEAQVLGQDPEAGNNRFRFVFVDTSKGPSNTEREIRIRETDGTLRTANSEERDQYLTEFVAGHKKSVRAPPMCREPALTRLIGENQHRHLLDAVTATQYPYQKDYREVHARVYEDVETRKLYSLMQDTVHWPSFLLWLVDTEQTDGLLTMLLSAERLEDAVKLSILQTTGSVPETLTQQHMDSFKAFVDGRVSEFNKTHAARLLSAAASLKNASAAPAAPQA
ncbi:uncharacterized protein MONBRDRAFT_33445 [Monosiga brevicollis MX1]|uniref:Uncharacterized protein n=1 Tax=Monosiga brevicollis TaxID=81824 RepID=A9V5G0_MONBE|nr:uncharacterized protein MONBRDRAFT_33445 [Monosiga brevicollis MX1]EDQ87276.1 predicted protein [Monosiga brevicollis MX1]|eukprot:XP_001747889.1 hypothetical protein [Monosiga brevicollis MX1]